ncbi:MAG: hypothetical protein QXQ60_08000 [Thermofilum sp.]
MSYLVVACRRCAGRRVVSLKGRSVPGSVRCPYCGSRIVVKESPFALFSSFGEAREYALRGRGVRRR